MMGLTGQVPIYPCGGWVVASVTWGMPFKILKDTLMQEAGIPTLVIDCDVAGPTYVLAEQMQRNAGETGRVS
jgi:hypothetical protein